MGKRITQQKRGHGGPRYKAPSHRYTIKSTYLKKETGKGKILDFTISPAHSAPIIKIGYPNHETGFIIAAEGLRVGEDLSYGEKASIQPGNILPLKAIPEGTRIFNIESQPGDNGKFCRSAGAFARILSKTKNNVTVQFPSKRTKDFSESCRASIGTVAGSGRSDKPFLKAGTMHKIRKARNKLYPSVSGTSMNAVDHPFGGTLSSRKGRPTVVPRGAPPGRKVGMLRASRTGRKKGKR